MIIKPQYLNNYQVINPLYDQFGDTSVKFYKTAYLISEEYYKPGITQSVDSDNNTVYNHPKMPKLISSTNQVIFPKGFDYSKYRLLDEEIERQDYGEKLLIVWQTWGYTPDMTFSQPGTISWQKPGMYDEDTTTGTHIIDFKATNLTWDNNNKRWCLVLDTYDEDYMTVLQKYKPNDIIRLERPPFGDVTQYYWYKAVSADIPIIQVTTRGLIINDFSVTFYDDYGRSTGSVPSARESGFFGTYYQYEDNVLVEIPHTIFIHKTASQRSPLASDFPCEIRSSFVTIENSNNLVNLQPAWTVQLGGQNTDTLTTLTVPTITEYKSKIGTNERLLGTSESLTQLLGNVYIKQGYYIKYQ